MKKVRSVEEYLNILRTKKSPITIRNYRQVLSQYARFLQVPLDELHNHLDPEDLIRYAMHISGLRDAGRKSTLITIRRYMVLNGVQFDELEHDATTVQITQEREDKPLTIDLLQKMMDQGNLHSRAIISFLISTGCRAGETAKILLSDVGRIENGRFVPDINGDVVQIRNEIAKRKKGGLVFLTNESREFLTIWLRDRVRYIADADRRTAQLYTTNTRHEKIPRKDTGKRIARQANDKRLFACSYSTIDKTFGRLYRAVDGERGGFRAKITAHACRAYFRTNAAKTMGVDLAEGILRHSGYLNAIYVRTTPEERLRQFRDGEAALFITRADHRVQSGKLSALEAQNRNLQERLNGIEQAQQERDRAITTAEQATPKLTNEDREWIARRTAELLKK